MKNEIERKRYCETCGRLKPYHKILVYRSMNESVEDRKEAIKNKDEWAVKHHEWCISCLKKELEDNNRLRLTCSACGGHLEQINEKEWRCQTCEMPVILPSSEKETKK